MLHQASINEHLALDSVPITPNKQKEMKSTPNTEQVFSRQRTTQTLLKIHKVTKIKCTSHHKVLSWFLPLIALSTLTSRQIREIKQKKGEWWQVNEKEFMGEKKKQNQSDSSSWVCSLCSVSCTWFLKKEALNGKIVKEYFLQRERELRMSNAKLKDTTKKCWLAAS